MTLHRQLLLVSLFLLSLPWASWLPDAGVSAQMIADTRYHAAQLDLGQVAVESRRGWWPFLLLCLLTYALLPRLLLWGLARRAYRGELARAFLAAPGAGSVLARMRAPVVTTHASDESHEDRDGPPVIQAQGAVLLEWAGALGDSSVQWQVEAHVQAGLGSPAEDLDSIEAINRRGPEHLLLATKCSADTSKLLVAINTEPNTLTTDEKPSMYVKSNDAAKLRYVMYIQFLVHLNIDFQTKYTCIFLYIVPHHLHCSAFAI